MEYNESVAAAWADRLDFLSRVLALTKQMAGCMLDRREMMVASAALSVGASEPAKAASLTVADVLERMHSRIGTEWREGGVDRIIVGDPATPVTGIATTMMATFDALKAAVARRANLVITHEPTFWSHPDTVTQLADDPLYKTKRAWMHDHGLVSYHLHDHWHARLPVDGINDGMARQMGWTRYRDPDKQRRYVLPPTTLAALARDFRHKLGDRTLRVIGDPDLPVSKVWESWGYCSAFPGIQFLDEDVDLLVIGEAQDWDLIAYAQDLVTAGRRKALIVLGHVVSEQWGMKSCAEWLKGFVTEVPVSFVPLIEPYWNLQKPVFEINTRL
jgi:putative NIF3 family GTP cyclohydrolase 1 type 2